MPGGDRSVPFDDASDGAPQCEPNGIPMPCSMAYDSHTADLPGFGTKWGSFAALGEHDYNESVINATVYGLGFQTNQQIIDRYHANGGRDGQTSDDSSSDGCTQGHDLSFLCHVQSLPAIDEIIAGTAVYNNFGMPTTQGVLPPPPPPPPASGDPCAGKKGPLDFSDKKGLRWGMDKHIFPRHIEQTKKYKDKSVYRFNNFYATAQSFGFPAKQAYVETLDQLTFELGTATENLDDETGDVTSISYTLSVPGINTPAGPVMWVVGADNTDKYAPKGSYTNTNTLVIDPDCVSVITSHPGIGTRATSNSSMIWDDPTGPNFFRFNWIFH